MSISRNVARLVHILIYLHENSYNFKTNTISYKFLLDEIPRYKLLKYMQHCQNGTFEKNVCEATMVGLP